MFLAKVVGKIVSTTKDEGLNGKKILVIAPRYEWNSDRKRNSKYR